MSIRSILIPAALAGAIIVPVGVLAQRSAAPSAPQGAPSTQQWGREHHHGMMSMMRELNLTDAQKTQIRQIVTEFRNSHTPGERPDPQSRAQMRDKIMNVLTPQQRAQFQAKMEQMRAQREEREGSEPAPESTPQA